MWRGLGVLRLAVPATGERADQPRDTERRRTGAGRDSPARAGAALDVGEPHQAAGAEDRGDEKVQPQAEDVMGGVDAQELLEDAKAGVAGDVEGEQPGRADGVGDPSQIRAPASARFQISS